MKNTVNIESSSCRSCANIALCCVVRLRWLVAHISTLLHTECRVTGYIYIHMCNAPGQPHGSHVVLCYVMPLHAQRTNTNSAPLGARELSRSLSCLFVCEGGGAPSALRPFLRGRIGTAGSNTVLRSIFTFIFIFIFIVTATANLRTAEPRICLNWGGGPYGLFCASATVQLCNCALHPARETQGMVANGIGRVAAAMHCAATARRLRCEKSRAGGRGVRWCLGVG